ncbi:MAG: chemotaxis protein CheW, partial [Rubrivivax sp.]|nr:chemotaxis protein CheW [Rubrivivax sp.]
MKAVRQPQGLVLTLQSQRHVMALRHVERLLPLAALTALPMAPPALLGLLDLHGRPVPVLDLQVLLGGVPTPATMRTRIAVLAAACSAAADCPALALVLQGTGQVTRWPADAGG